MLRLLLVRHGETLANQSGFWIGQGESEMTSEGVKSIEWLKQQLISEKFDGVFTSPSQRAVWTSLQLGASHSIGKEDIQLIEALKEINFGRFEGKNFKWVKAYEPDEIEKMLCQGSKYIYPQGESLCMQHQRVARWLHEFIQKYEEGNYLICAHGGTIRCILSELLIGNETLHWRFKIDPASLTIVTLNEGYAVIEALNYKQNQV